MTPRSPLDPDVELIRGIGLAVYMSMRDATGQRIDPYDNPVTRKSPGNHTSIDWDLE